MYIPAPGLSSVPKKRWGRATRETPADAPATAGLPSELPESGRWPCPRLPGTSFPRGKSHLQGTSGVPAAVPGDGGPSTPLPGGPGAERRPEAGGRSPGPGPAASPRRPSFLTGQTVQTRNGPAWLDARRPSSVRTGNHLKRYCCPKAALLPPPSPRARSVGLDFWFNPSGWGHTLWEEEGAWKPLVTGLQSQCCLPPTGPGRARPASRHPSPSVPLPPSSPGRGGQGQRSGSQV